MTTKQTEVGEYVACPICNSNGQPLTRVELEFENGEQILYCGHHRQKQAQQPATPTQAASVRDAIKSITDALDANLRALGLTNHERIELLSPLVNMYTMEHGTVAELEQERDQARAQVADLLSALRTLDMAHSHETLCRAKEQARAAIARVEKA